MSLQVMEDQEILRDTARRFLSEKAPVSQLRRLRDSRDDAGFSTALWSDFANMGYTGMLVPEAFGGSGLGIGEAAVLMEQLATTCVPPHSWPVAWSLSRPASCRQEAQQMHWLPRLVEGKAVATLRLTNAPSIDLSMSKRAPFAVTWVGA